MTPAEVSALEEREFVALLGGVFEHSPWVAERSWRRRPFRSVDELHRAMLDEVDKASPEEQLALVRAHPELAGAEAKEGSLTPDSSSEQARLGFTGLSRPEFLDMADLNRCYRDKHGFPCIVALRLHATRESVLAEMRRGLENPTEREKQRALEQIGHIARGRLEKVFKEV